MRTASKEEAMEIRPIRTEQDYRSALSVIGSLMEDDPQTGDPKLDALDVLATLVEAYEARHYAIEAPDPIAAIEIRMAEKDINRRQLAALGGIPESRISEALNYKRPLSINMIRNLSEVLDLPVAVLVKPYSRARVL
jgi:HTH-type transcriptional regulator/antitoxin HigA